jgi:4-diphosphocytidyl-2-C-methyl-D-erythritol kinase
MVPVRLWDGLFFVSRRSNSTSRPAELRLVVRNGSPPSRDLSDLDSLPAGENLVIKALEALRRRSGCTHGADILLVKRIPAAAGMGGGSSDAASALQLANIAWGLRWCRERLPEVAVEVGSDVPFFIYNAAAVCRGRGEHVEPLSGLPPLHFVVVKPPVALGTADVYRQFSDAQKSQGGNHHVGVSSLIASLRRGRLHEAGRAIHNSLQFAAAAMTPWIERLQRTFDRFDFFGHQLSGSGSAYFGLCRNVHQARRLATVLRAQRLGQVVALRSCP